MGYNREVVVVRRVVAGLLMISCFVVGAVVGSSSARLPFVISEETPFVGEMIADVVARLGPPMYESRDGDVVKCVWRIEAVRGRGPLGYYVDSEAGVITSVNVR